MITRDQIIQGRIIYEPHRPLEHYGINEYRVRSVAAYPNVAFDFTDSRKNLGRGEPGFVTTRHEGMFVSIAECVHEIADMVKEDLEETFTDYTFEVVPRKKDVHSSDL